MVAISFIWAAIGIGALLALVAASFVYERRWRRRGRGRSDGGAMIPLGEEDWDV